MAMNYRFSYRPVFQEMTTKIIYSCAASNSFGKIDFILYLYILGTFLLCTFTSI